MSLTNLYKCTMEETAISSLGLINIFVLNFSSNWEKFLTKFRSRLPKQPEFAETSDTVITKQIKELDSSNGDTETSLTREDVEMVMGKLNFFCNNDEKQIAELFGENEISALFVGKEPSFDEVKEAFYVFDENNDGFIDAEELKRVLCALSLVDGSDVEDSRAMIARFDGNADGKIDFDEFVKLVEISL